MPDVRLVRVDPAGLGPQDDGLYAIADLLDSSDGVIIVASPADPGFWHSLHSHLERLGARWPRAVYLDAQRDTDASGLSLDELADIWKAYLEEASRHPLPVTLNPARGLSRRDIVKRGISLALAYPSHVEADASCASLKNCRLCLSSCPYDALSGKPPRPLEDRCLGCGLCASSCPQGLLVQPSAPPSALRTLIRLASEKGVQRLVVVCARGRAGVYEHLRGSPGKTLVVQLPCAASLRLHEYLYARLKGVTVTPYCPDPGCPAREAYLSYTSLLREADSTFNPAGAEPAGYTLPALAAALQPLRESTGLPLYDLHVDPGKCTLCGACARACRTGALVYSQDGARAALLFTQSRCVGCRDCEAVCPEHALTLVRRVNPERLKPQHVPVLEAPMAHCASCGAPIAPLPTLKAVEEKLRLKNAPEAVIQSLYLCPRCKQQQALAGYLKDLAHGREET